VARQIVSQFEHQCGYGTLKLYVGVEGLEFHENRVKWVGRTPSREPFAFRKVILALGFGVEKPVPGLETHASYWRLDPFEQSWLDGASRTRESAIAGSGDGALIDILGASVESWRQEDLLEIASLRCMERLRDAAERIENEVALQPESERDLFVDRPYAEDELALPPEVAGRLRRRNTRVHWIAAEPHLAWRTFPSIGFSSVICCGRDGCRGPRSDTCAEFALSAPGNSPCWVRP
jgi:hypothetical protein